MCAIQLEECLAMNEIPPLTNKERQNLHRDREARRITLTRQLEVDPGTIDEWQANGWLSDTAVLKHDEINTVAQDLINGRSPKKT